MSGPQVNINVIEGEIAELCLQTCARHRTGDINRVNATMKIFADLQKTTVSNPDTRKEALRAYLRVLDKNEEELHRESEPVALPGTAAPQDHAQINPSLHAMVHQLDFADKVSNTAETPKKRSRAKDESDSKRETEKFDETALPWYSSNVEREGLLLPALITTRKRVKLYTENIKAVKRSLLIAIKKPEFADSEWDNLLRNRSVCWNE